MELRQLKYFVRAAELLNFTQAADDLYITQSTLSHQIKELETSLDILLFDRIGKRVRLTEAGETMLGYARKTIRQAEEGRQVLMDLNNLQTGKLTIGATYGLTELLIQSITAFNQEFPGVQVRIEFGSTSDLLQKIRAFEIDCMLSFLPSSPNLADLVISQLFTAHLSLILHQSHAWAKLKKVSLQKLSELPLVLPSPSYSIRNFLDGILLKKGIELNAKIEINDIHSLLELTNTKNWNTILMNSSLFDFAELTAVPIEGKNMIREATITVSSEIYQKKALLAFQDIILKKSLAYRQQN
ncbi:LysR family transcriptional regulator [Mangrovibacterium diazotrophicum]|uniref:LysR family cyn operon transcriptional activator n=1 Tax=Mangrovibacterium diazotrophicum TaxID=1261403 RepID=A0A419W4N3_9BACT|nr:LysR substrate-binding domain-containing protein [Mangrovibacterium diazotrophicum]RKD90409.1 LysR family cyn operon transcriptional activator [Mangrovibacterium diazotrophicum]